ncbi:hypothetical protein DC20_15715 [Rufibacter tibetensis]|uniref:Uncharacterized protein n=1 Tax=Rufibacter tibetensis TaxID=512763 RepID=A0A0P0D028_9BACT|nr:hypothetical protein DC20_15715 [Rufibacter tibetensis]
MNWSNISDEELDRLFKASADNFDLPFVQEAWTAMDQKLEMVLERHSWFRRFFPNFCILGFVTLNSISPITYTQSNLTR